MKKLIALSAFLLLSNLVFCQMDLSKYKLMFNGKVVTIAQLDSLQKIYGSFSIKRDMSTTPPTATFTPTTAEMTAEKINSMLAGKKRWLGNSLPAFEIKDIHGRLINNANLKNKVVVVNFYFVNCSPCIKEMPELNKLVTKYKNRHDVVFIAFALDDKKAVEKFLIKHPYNYEQVPKAKNLIENSFQIEVFPTHIVADTNGKVVYYTQGLEENTIKELDSAIEKVSPMH